MSEKWYVYRYCLSNPILKSAKTELDLTPGDTTWEASFSMFGRAQPVNVPMVADAATDAWYGNWQAAEGKSFDFRWTRVGAGTNAMLIGHVSERYNIPQREFFVAVRSKRDVPLSTASMRYDFGSSYVVPLAREARSETGCLSVDLSTDPEIRLGGRIYKNIVSLNYEGGLKITGKSADNLTLGLWLLPVDASGALLATGYLHHDMSEAAVEAATASEPPGSENTVPGEQHCTHGLCGTHGSCVA